MLPMILSWVNRKATVRASEEQGPEVPFPPANFMSADGTAGTAEQQDQYDNGADGSDSQKNKRTVALVQSQERDGDGRQHQLRNAAGFPETCLSGQFFPGRSGTVFGFLSVALQPKDSFQCLFSYL